MAAIIEWGRVIPENVLPLETGQLEIWDALENRTWMNLQNSFAGLCIAIILTAIEKNVWTIEGVEKGEFLLTTDMNGSMNSGAADRGYPLHIKDIKGGTCQIPGRDQRRTVKAVRVSHHCAVYYGYPEFYQYHERQHSGQTAWICFPSDLCYFHPRCIAGLIRP